MGLLMNFDALTPEGWRDFLYYRLTERWQLGLLSPSGRHRSRPWMEVSDYYEGHHPLQFATPKFIEAFGELFSAFADNWCGTIVDAPVERLKVQGFRYGEQSDADTKAWEIWQENNLDGAVTQMHSVAIELGAAYWLIDPAEDGGAPRITAEHPSQTIVWADPGDHMNRLAALKTWIAPDGRGMCTLWLPTDIYRWECGYANTRGMLVELPIGVADRLNTWEERKEGNAHESNDLGVVPVIPIRNRPRLVDGVGRSDIEPVLGLQNTINKLGSDTLVGSEFTAWPQRVLTGVQRPKDPQTGEMVSREKLEAGVSRLLMFENPQARVQEWAQADPARLVSLIDLYTQHLAAQSRTPPHYLLGQVVNASSDALKAAEAGLVSRTRGKWPEFGEGHEEMIRLSFLAMGDKERAKQSDCETIWGDPETRTEAEAFDAAVKGLAIGLPKKIVWERLGMSPTEIRRAEAEAASEALLMPGGMTQNGAAELLQQKAAAAAAQANGQPAAVAGSGRDRSLPGTLAEPDDLIHVAPITVRA